MKFLHTADLHIGKRIHEYALLKDQEDVLQDILRIGKENKIDAILLAGDLYDKSVPSAEAVELFDRFLTSCMQEGWQVLAISGNHDSAERIGFASDILRLQGVHLCKPYAGRLESVVLEDAHGPCHFYLLPFIKPLHVRAYHPDISVGDYEDALRRVIAEEKIDSKQRNVLLSHQFVTHQGTSPERSDSEIISVGGMENIDASVFSAFDYVALGHIHRPQKVSRETVRYAGSILKYSFSEMQQQKSVVLVEMGEKNQLQLSLIPLKIPRDMISLKGPIDTLLDPSFYKQVDRSAYAHIVLTDESAVDALGKLRLVYPYLMRLEFYADAVQQTSIEKSRMDVEEKTSLELFESFYKLQNAVPLDGRKKETLTRLFLEMGEKK